MAIGPNVAPPHPAISDTLCSGSSDCRCPLGGDDLASAGSAVAVAGAARMSASRRPRRADAEAKVTGWQLARPETPTRWLSASARSSYAFLEMGLAFGVWYNTTCTDRGEPACIVTAGCPLIQGRTMAEKTRYFTEHLDHICTTLMQGCRGHEGMFGAVLMLPTSNEDQISLFVPSDC